MSLFIWDFFKVSLYVEATIWIWIRIRKGDKSDTGPHPPQKKLRIHVKLKSESVSACGSALGTSDFDKISYFRCVTENFGRQWKSKICL